MADRWIFAIKYLKSANIIKWIKKEGQIFVIKPEKITSKKSPLDVDGIDLNLTGDEIVIFIHEGGTA